MQISYKYRNEHGDTVVNFLHVPSARGALGRGLAATEALTRLVLDNEFMRNHPERVEIIFDEAPIKTGGIVHV
jgi:hypothetical protein